VKLSATAWPYYRHSPSTGLNAASCTVIITLQSHARLLDIGKVAQSPSELGKHYERTWFRLGGGLLKLSHYFARQELFGGKWWWRHYVQENESGYCPELFTTPGSTFIFTIPADTNRDKLQVLLEGWQRLGVSDTKDAYGGDDWQHNPWLTQNGYGEVHIIVSDREIEGRAP
jgi:hypothetical protein